MVNNNVNDDYNQSSNAQTTTPLPTPVQVSAVQNTSVGTPQAPKKKKSFFKGLLKGALIIVVVGVVSYIVYSKVINPVPIAVETDYASSGRAVYDAFLDKLHNYDAAEIDNFVGVGDGDSYIAQEWAYVNEVPLREEFITKVCGLTDFIYPQVNVMSTRGKIIKNADGTPKTELSAMNNGELLTVVVPDYTTLMEEIKVDAAYIQQLFSATGVDADSPIVSDTLADLLCQYLCDKDSLPTTTAEISLPIANGKVTDDGNLDKVLFGSDEFHNMCKQFAQTATNYTGKKEVTHQGMVKQHNPEYDEWKALFDKYYAEDNGHFIKGVSKWEPWYVRDANNVIQLDENGQKIVNYYSVKDENGKDWIEPVKEIEVEGLVTEEEDDPWFDERSLAYTWIGTYYIQNEYRGDSDTSFHIGNGTFESPAGVGTPIVTKVLGTDGAYHSVRVALTGYWLDDNAIDYVEKFSQKNRGFTTASVYRLITFEFTVENLENQEFTAASECSLSDRNGNLSPRTGSMYGFTDVFTLPPHGKLYINDWATSTELDQKYVCWGKTFGRDFKMIYFRCLAGTGDIPTYSAFKEFCGSSEMDENADNTNAPSSTDSISSTASGSPTTSTMPTASAGY